MNIKINQKGQGLLELIIAIGIIVTGLFGVWTLFLSNFTGEQESSYRIVGANLAREGVEIVKNIRDSNWLKIEDNEQCSAQLCGWDHGMTAGPGIDTESAQTAVIGAYSDVDYATLDFAPDSVDDPGAKLYINTASGLYVHNSTDAIVSSFSRLITLEELCCPDANHDLKCDTISFSGCGLDMVDKLKVAVDVQSHVRWNIKGKQRDVVVEDVLYNWK